MASLQKTQPMWVDRSGKEIETIWRGWPVSVAEAFSGRLAGRPGKAGSRYWQGRRLDHRHQAQHDVAQHIRGCGQHYATHFLRTRRESRSAPSRAGTTGGWWIQPASGSGTQEKLENPGTWGSVLSWSPNGRYVFFMVQNNATRQDVYYADLDGDKKLTSLPDLAGQ